MTVEERLQELLDEKDHQIRSMRDRLSTYEKEKDERNWEWNHHRTGPEEARGAPFPRLQLLLREDDGYNQEWEIAYVRVSWGHEPYVIPLMRSERGGGPLREDRIGNEDTPAPARFFEMTGMVMDLIRFADDLQMLPVYIIIKDRVWEMIRGTPVVMRRQSPERHGSGFSL